MTDQIKFLLDEEEIPRTWYNIIADLPEPPAPVMHPGTGEPVGPDDLAPVASQPACPGGPTGKGIGYTSADLLQV